MQISPPALPPCSLVINLPVNQNNNGWLEYNWMVLTHRGSSITIFQRRSSRALSHLQALVAVSIAIASAAAVARLDVQAAVSDEIRSSIQDEMTRSSLLCQAGRYTEAEPILLRCLSQYELTGKQDAFLLSILTNLELVYSQLGKPKEAAACQAKRRALEARFDAVDMSFPSSEPKVRQSQFASPRAAAQLTTITSSSSSSSSLPQEQRVPRQEQSLKDVAPATNGIQAEVRTVIAATEHDRELISDPTTGERTVFDHYETRYRDVTVGLRTPYQEPVYRREQYNVTKESEIPVFEDLHSMCSSHALDDIVYQRCKTAIMNGGAVLELDNGFTVLIAEKVNPDDWRLAKVRVQKDPTLPLPAMSLTNLRTGATVNCEVLDSR